MAGDTAERTGAACGDRVMPLICCPMRARWHIDRRARSASRRRPMCGSRRQMPQNAWTHGAMIEVIAGRCRMMLQRSCPSWTQPSTPIWRSWTAAQCLSTLACPAISFWSRKPGDEVAGFALSRWVGEEEELLLIGVCQDCATARAYRANARSNHRTCHEIRVERSYFSEVRDGNPAQYFYKTLGFRADRSTRQLLSRRERI